MSYPMSKYPTPSGSPRCMLPRHVDEIHTSSQCRNMVAEARDAALIRGTALNDPTFLQYADSFNIFMNGDQAQTKTFGNNRGTIAFHGGCDLLIRPDTREALWPGAREFLRAQLQRYHANLPSLPFGPEHPTLVCFNSGDGKWHCPK